MLFLRWYFYAIFTLMSSINGQSFILKTNSVMCLDVELVMLSGHG